MSSPQILFDKVVYVIQKSYLQRKKNRECHVVIQLVSKCHTKSQKKSYNLTFDFEKVVVTMYGLVGPISLLSSSVS